MSSVLKKSLSSKRLNVTLNSTVSSRSLGSKKQYISLITPGIVSSRKNKTFRDLKKQAVGKEGTNLIQVHELVKTRKVLNREEGEMRIRKWKGKPNPEIDTFYQGLAETTAGISSQTGHLQPMTPISKLMIPL